MKRKIYLVGYQPKFFWKKKHTNFWPWDYLTQTFNLIGYEAFHLNHKNQPQRTSHIYCWNELDTLQLIEKHTIPKDSILIQKLTSFDTSQNQSRLDR